MAYSPQKPVSNIVGVGTELLTTVAIDSELFSAGWASKSIASLSLYQVKVAVPPLVPAGVTAEPFPLPSRILCDGPATLLTNGICRWCGQAVPPAKGFHCVDG